MSDTIKHLQELADKFTHTTRKFGANYVAMYESDRDTLLEAIAAIKTARSAALEEAATVVDEYAASVLRVAAMPGEEKPLHQAAHNMCHWTLTRTATVIRALKDKPHE